MNESKKYGGVVVPMISPLKDNYKIDENATEKVVTNLIINGCFPFVLGTTGESSSISTKEKIKLVKKTADVTSGKKTVYAGISGNCYDETVELSKTFYQLGAEVHVAHLPSYYSLDQEQILRYYEQLADAIPCPLIIYNIPITTHISIDIETIDRLSKHENIIGFKDSERGEERLNNGLELWKNRADFSYLLGWAAMSSHGLQNGLDGIVPSTGNLVPALYKGIYDAVQQSNVEKANQLQEITNEISAYYQKDRILSRAFPVFKAMMNAFGLCEPFVAPPLITLSSKEISEIKDEVLLKYGKYKTNNDD